MPDLNLYRRHSPTCKFLPRGRDYTKCKCPVWCDGRVNGRRIHISLKTRDWDRAERKMLSMDPDVSIERLNPITRAIESYLDDCRARSLADSTVTSYRNSLDALASFCEDQGIIHCERISLDVLTQFRAALRGRADKAMPKTQRKTIETTRAFFRFCQKRGWMTANPAEGLKPPRDSGPPTLPFEQAEIDAILDAVGKIQNPNVASAARARIRNRALLLVMLYSGMRVSDVALLERGRVNMNTGQLLLRTMKTGTAMYVRLSQNTIDALAALPIESTRYFFWSGNGKVSSVIGSLRRSVECVLKLADVSGHPHRFRDTFAVRLLEEDTPIRTVQLLLGHSSVQTTERHYAPYVRSQQRLLDAATAKLNFGESSAHLPDDRLEDGLRDTKRRVLPFPA